MRRSFLQNHFFLPFFILVKKHISCTLVIGIRFLFLSIKYRTVSLQSFFSLFVGIMFLGFVNCMTIMPIASLFLNEESHCMAGMHETGSQENTLCDVHEYTDAVLSSDGNQSVDTLILISSFSFVDLFIDSSFEKKRYSYHPPPDRGEGMVYLQYKIAVQLRA